MGFIKDTFFGGSAGDAADAQVNALREAMGIQSDYYEQARQDALDLYGPGYADMMQGFQAAQDQIAQGRTSTADIYTQATQNANRYMQQGAQGSISALLGQPQQMMPPQGFQGGTISPIQSGQKPGDVVRPPTNPTDPSTGGPIQPAPSQPVQPQPQPQPGLPVQPPTFDKQKLLSQQGDKMRAAVMPSEQTGLRKNVQTLDYQAPPPSMVTDPSDAGGGQGPADPNAPGMNPTGLPQVNVPPSQNIGAADLPAINMPQGGDAFIMPDVSGIGLAGAEQAITGGAAGAENALTGGLAGATGTFSDALAQQMGILGGSQMQGRQDIFGGMSQQAGALQAGAGQARSDISGGLRGQLGALGAGFGGAESALNQGFGQGRQDLLGTMGGVGNIFGQAIGNVGSAGSGAVGSIRQGVDTATGRLDPYAQAGQGALGVEAAMAGAFGPQAQAQAYANFSESPAQKFNRERQEQALLRNASAVGGLRGGSTLTALQEQASGIAAQQEQRYLDNLRNLAGRGQQAAGQQAGFNMQGGQAAANAMQNTAATQASLYGQQAGLQGQLGQNLANMAAQQGQAVGGLRSQLGQLQSGALGQAAQNQAGIAQGLGQNLSGVYGQGSQTLAGMGQNYANMGVGAIGNMAGQLGQAQLGTGQQLAGLRQGTGQQLGGLRMQTGQQVAGQLSGLGQGMAQNQLNLGNQLAGLDQGSINNIANLLQNQGQSGYNSRMQLAQILANLSAGQGTNLASLQSRIGEAQAGGAVGQAGGMQQGIGNVVGLISQFWGSDERLKDNMQEVMRAGDIGLYTYTWKDNDALPESVRGKPSYGVKAQEVQDKYPHLVQEQNGYLAVDYAGLAEVISNDH